jgi:hypothetical protein
MKQSLKQFLYGILFGVLLFPIAYIGRLWWKHRSERVDFDDSEWP